ncbi:MAG: precorrin-6y C5,15-methyltransferase (decarboxylating) subunit CbiE [Deltaproteobacteria bacterium]|nr:precorrin-6y C5,15-methyltransferase (decarboxylating) subunit CbiE [Deltaproteobacteria bacterium]
MIYVIGIGTDGKDSLSDKTVRLIRGAGLIAGGARHLAEFAEVKAKKLPITSGLDSLAAAIRAHVKGGGNKNAVVIATGDPLLFGIGGFIVKTFGKRAVRVIPNISTVQEAFARIKESSNNVRVLSAHGRNASVEALAGEISKCEKAAIFTDPANSPAVIARALLRGRHGKRAAADYAAYVCEALGTKDEKISTPSLAALSRRKKFAPLNILILIKKEAAVPPSSQPSPRRGEGVAFGIPDAAFAHSKGMITKEEIRVVSLAKLRLGEKSVVWDIGAGSGSVAIEAARLAVSGRVYAIEKKPARVRQIERNRRRFNAHNIEVISGKAPGCLARGVLPAPDAAFIGGGGADIIGILAFVLKKIKKGGRIVVNAVTIETASRAFDFFKKGGIEKEMLMINISRTRGVDIRGGLNLFSANNPVFIITGTKP